LIQRRSIAGGAVAPGAAVARVLEAPLSTEASGELTALPGPLLPVWLAGWFSAEAFPDAPLFPEPLLPVVLEAPLSADASGELVEVPEPVFPVWLPG
jgi:hypothetical protein